MTIQNTQAAISGFLQGYGIGKEAARGDRVRSLLAGYSPSGTENSRLKDLTVREAWQKLQMAKERMAQATSGQRESTCW